ncbi:hypothetical protein ACN47E_008833 [Coniothyrium glycines]
MAPLSLYASFYSSLIKSLLSLVFARLYAPQRPILRDLSGQIAIVTGSNSGLGLSIATSLSKQGATVYLACRNIDKGQAAIKEIVKTAGEKSADRLFCWKLDTSDSDSVRAFCEKWQQDRRPIDMLVHNAGIASAPNTGASKSVDGLELVYATNFLGSFLMTHLLEQSLSKNARVVFTSSTGSYSGMNILAEPPAVLTAGAAVYGRSKALQVLFAHALQQHFAQNSRNKRSAHAFTPGFTSSPIFGKFEITWTTWVSNPLFAILKVTEKHVAVDTDEGAKTGAWLAGAGDTIEGGRYWERQKTRTSIVDLSRGALGEDAFWSAVRTQWRRWESDAKVQWTTDL